MSGRDGRGGGGGGALLEMTYAYNVITVDINSFFSLKANSLQSIQTRNQPVHRSTSRELKIWLIYRVVNSLIEPKHFVAVMLYKGNLVHNHFVASLT